MNQEIYLQMLEAMLAHRRHGEIESLIASLMSQRVPYKQDLLYVLARSRFLSGDFNGATAIFGQLQRISPDSFEYLLEGGVCFAAKGDIDSAEKSFRRCLVQQPSNVVVQTKLADLLLQKGCLVEAQYLAEQSLKIEANMPEATIVLVRVLRRLNKHTEFCVQLSKAMSSGPFIPEYLNDLGLEAVACQEFVLAETLFGKALTIAPDQPVYLFHLGHSLSELGRHREAIECHEKALKLAPHIAEIHNSYGNVLFATGDCQAAIASYRKSITLNSSFPDAYGNLGRVLLSLRRPKEALSFVEEALRLAPEVALNYERQGAALMALGCYVKAETAFKKALELDESLLLSITGLAEAAMSLGKHEESGVLLNSALEKVPDSISVRETQLFYLNYISTTTNDEYFSYAEEYGQKFSRKGRINSFHVLAGRDKRLRIGMVSGDFNNHPVGYLLLGVLRKIETRSFEVFLYGNQPEQSDDDITEQIKQCSSGWRRVFGADDQSVAEQIAADGIDLLLDLSGVSRWNRLPVFALKPAPVQASWMGYFASTGLQEIDYILADRCVLPESEAKYFIEKVCYLPDSYYCYTPPEVTPDVSGLPALLKKQFVFGCFNNRSKIATNVIQCWASILKNTPHSLLYLKTKALGGKAEQELLLQEFIAHGVLPQQLRIEGQSSIGDYFRAFHEVDIALDPYPYTGGMTSLDGLWMGVPVLTMKGKRFIGRQGEMILNNLGLTDWIASDVDDYIEKAIEFSKDIEGLAALRSGMRDRMRASPLCQPERFARSFEQALRGMWTEWCERREPAREERGA